MVITILAKVIHHKLRTFSDEGWAANIVKAKSERDEEERKNIPNL